MRGLGGGTAVVLVVLALSGALAAQAAAATITVNTTSDVVHNANECQGVAGDCSLRQALDAAQEGGTVSLPASATPYQLTLGVIDIVRSVTISGAGARSTVIEQSSGSAGMFDDADLAMGEHVTIEDVTLSGGSTAGSGGALDLESGATFALTRDAFTNDSAQHTGGAIEVASGTTANITDSTIGPSDTAVTTGGGIDNSGGTASLTDSTVSGDSAANGGGISSAGNVSQPAVTTLSFTTIAFNSASAAGGDLYSNTPGNDPPAVSAGDSIIADGAAPSGGDCNNNPDGFTSALYNLTDGIQATANDACGLGTGDALGDARLGPLQNNGGPTDTIALAAGSPAIGLVSGADNGCAGTDQRGADRGGGSVCDAGALESGHAENAPLWSVAHDFATSPQANPSPDSFGHAGVWSYLEAPWTTEQPPPAPSADTLLADHATNSCGQDAWAGSSGGVPSVAYNATGSTTTCGTATGPVHSVVMQPSAGDYAVVAWKSPVSGTISVAGSFESMDASGGHGAAWYVENGSTTIASGTDDVGGSAAFDPAPLSVTQGQTLYFILGPSAEDDASADTTELSLTITAAPGACASSITIDAVQVVADCISPQGDGTFLASGHTRVGDGAEIVEPGTQTPATLVLNPSSHTISVNGGGGAGRLEAGGVNVASGHPVIDTQPVTDSTGLVRAAAVTGLDTFDLELSGWSFAPTPVTPTAYLAPADLGGGAILDGRLTLPGWLGSTIRFGSQEFGGYPSGVTGQLAAQVGSSGFIRVLNDAFSFRSTAFGTPGLALTDGELIYPPSGPNWGGPASLTFAKLAGVPVADDVSDGHLTSVSATFSCVFAGTCSGSDQPTLGGILNIEDADAQLLGLSAIDYTPGHVTASPALRLKGGLIGDLLSGRGIAGGSFSYGLTGRFTAKGTVGLEPLYGGKFPAPTALRSGNGAGGAVAALLARGDAGIELTGATISYSSPNLLRVRGTAEVPPPRFPYRFLSGPLTVDIHPPTLSGSGAMTMSVPGVIPVIGGLRVAGARARITGASASAVASTPRYCAAGVGCTHGLAVAVTFKYRYGGFSWKLDGHGAGGFTTISGGRSDRVTLRHRARFVSFAIRGVRGAPHVELVGPAGRGGRRTLTLSSSRGAHNHTGAVAWINSSVKTEDFLVLLPRTGTWTVKRLGGPRIASVLVTVPR